MNTLRCHWLKHNHGMITQETLLFTSKCHVRNIYKRFYWHYISLTQHISSLYLKFCRHLLPPVVIFFCSSSTFVLNEVKKYALELWQNELHTSEQELLAAITHNADRLINVLHSTTAWFTIIIIIIHAFITSTSSVMLLNQRRWQSLTGQHGKDVDRYLKRWVFRWCLKVSKVGKSLDINMSIPDCRSKVTEQSITKFSGKSWNMKQTAISTSTMLADCQQWNQARTKVRCTNLKRRPRLRQWLSSALTDFSQEMCWQQKHCCCGSTCPLCTTLCQTVKLYCSRTSATDSLEDHLKYLWLGVSRQRHMRFRNILTYLHGTRRWPQKNRLLKAKLSNNSK